MRSNGVQHEIPHLKKQTKEIKQKKEKFNVITCLEKMTHFYVIMDLRLLTTTD